MGLTEETTLANAATFQARIRAAMIRRAIAVMEMEPPETDAQRLSLAKYTLQQPDSVAIRVAQVAAALGATGTITDTALVDELGTRWTTLAKLLIY